MRTQDAHVRITYLCLGILITNMFVHLYEFQIHVYTVAQKSIGHVSRAPYADGCVAPIC